eukprot:1622835-Lingulodinium_polyedra.AAC.1
MAWMRDLMILSAAFMCCFWVWVLLRLSLHACLRRADSQRWTATSVSNVMVQPPAGKRNDAPAPMWR